MPFKPTTLPTQITAARNEERQAVGGPITPFSAGAAQRAKESSARWTKGPVRNPDTDSAPAWFSGGHPFSQQRFENQRNFQDWKDRFLGETDMGFSFAPPPPEPEPAPAAKPKSDQEAA